MIEIKDFPKLESPFIRETIGKRSVVTPQIAPGYEWVFSDPGVMAVDKLHGTNICLHINQGIIWEAANRKNLILPDLRPHTNYTAFQARLIQGILEALQHGWIPKEDGRVYGEFIGPTVNTNIHKLKKHLFVPFSYLKQKCHWKKWFSHEYPKDYETISAWFKDIPSLFTNTYTSQFALAEGLIFYHPDGRMAKLRRDMFPWYKKGE